MRVDIYWALKFLGTGIKLLPIPPGGGVLEGGKASNDLARLCSGSSLARNRGESVKVLDEETSMHDLPDIGEEGQKRGKEGAISHMRIRKKRKTTKGGKWLERDPSIVKGTLIT